MEILEKRVDTKFEEAKTTLSTKEDLASVRVDMQRMKAEIIKWMFIFWIGQIGALIGILAVFFK